MTAALRTFVVVTALGIAACGNGSTDTPTENRGEANGEATTSTTAGTHGGDVTESAEGGSEESVPTGVEASPSTTTGGPRTDTGPTADEPADAGAAQPSVFVPPAGRYLYDATGHVETTGLTESREPVPPTSTDQVDVTDGPGATRLTVTTRDGDGESSQEIDVTQTEARLVRLGYRPDLNGPSYQVNPDPPALLARLPYRVGDAWEIAWNDPSIGISGVGTGAVTGQETVDTPAGTFDTVVITVTQRLRGTIEGTLTVTSWIDRATGIQAKQHLVTEFRDATGARRTDATRVLRERPT